MNKLHFPLLPFIVATCFVSASEDSFLESLPIPEQAPRSISSFLSDEVEGDSDNQSFQSAGTQGLELPLPSEGKLVTELTHPDMAGDDYLPDQIHPRKEGNAKALLNAFIATIAAETPILKKQHARYRENREPGVIVGYSKNLGKYTFRPKTWDDLTEVQQQSIVKDPRLKSFLISMRSPENHPKSEWNYGRQERGTYSADGYAEAEVAKMRVIVESLKEEQRVLLAEMKTSFSQLKGEVGSIRIEQTVMLEDLNSSVVSLKVKQDEALSEFHTDVLLIQEQQTTMIAGLNSSVESLKSEQDTAIAVITDNIKSLRSTQSGLMAELNYSVTLAIEEHPKILNSLKQHTASFNAEWNQIRGEVYAMMQSATPVEIITNSSSREIGPGQVQGSYAARTIEPIHHSGPQQGRINASQSGAYIVMPKPSLGGADFVLKVPSDDTREHFTITIDGAAFIRGELL
jgi:hypothetical protein